MIAIGIDCGTSALKAVLVEDDTVLASASEAYEPDRPHPGWSEQDPDVWRRATGRALATLRQDAPVAFRSVKTISFSGQMHGLVALDAAGRPLRPAMLHNDGRAVAEANELWTKHRALADVVGVKPMPGFVAPKALWLSRHEPDTLKRAATIVLPKDYVRMWFCGEPITDASDAAGMWWLDEKARAWSEAAIDASGVAVAQAPKLVEANAAVGLIAKDVAAELGLPRGVIIGAGGGDASVGALGLGALKPRDAFISLGTASQLVVISDAYRAAPETLVHSFAYAAPGRWFRMAAMLNGASALAFAARLFDVPVDALEREAADAPGSDVLFLPYLAGERTPHDDAAARGGWFGLNASTSRADCARAVMEGVAFTLVDAQQALQAAGDEFAAIGLTGGGSKSRFWAKLIASALGREVLRYRGGETGPALGAARLARAAAGLDLDAIALAPPVEETIAPEPQLSEELRRRHERFVALYRALKPEFQRTA